MKQFYCTRLFRSSLGVIFRLKGRLALQLFLGMRRLLAAGRWRRLVRANCLTTTDQSLFSINMGAQLSWDTFPCSKPLPLYQTSWYRDFNQLRSMVYIPTLLLWPIFFWAIKGFSIMIDFCDTFDASPRHSQGRLEVRGKAILRACGITALHSRYLSAWVRIVNTFSVRPNNK